MPLDRVLSEITGKNKARLGQIDAEAKKEAAVVMAEARKEAAALEKSRDAVTQKKVEELRQRELSLAELNLKKDKLKAKKEVMDDVMKGVLERLSALPQEKHQNALKKLLARAKAEISEGTVYANSRDSAFVKGQGLYDFGGEIDCSGGIIVEKKGAGMSMDLTYDRILEEVWKGSQKDVADMLFG